MAVIMSTCRRKKRQPQQEATQPGVLATMDVQCEGRRWCSSSCRLQAADCSLPRTR
jgi:hypothetical protein